ncbi:MAG: 1-acyl-sn-glycerol-3-phosphate acyltransferase [Marinilabiliales bacterium]|nr:MAG: 1-acyl-sn-glycerol-3-phosphate acyltransferase [Marinilabiliales bacterium]
MPRAGKKLLLILVHWWAKNILRIGGVKVNLINPENIPKHNNVCYVSNHQSNYDIGIIIASLPMIVGFIAKVELKKFLPLRVWMDEISCLFINRNKPKLSIKSVRERIYKIHKGNALLIFPEGTRSKSNQIQEFRTGSLKLVFENNIEIVPVTIRDSYLRYEKYNRITPGKTDIIIHKTIKPSENTDKDLILDQIKNTIQNGLIA